MESEKESEIKMKRIASVLFVIFAFIPGLFSDIGAQPLKNCQECDRHGLLVFFDNPHNPDYLQKMEEWRDCMQQQLGNYQSFDSEDPKIVKACAVCDGLLPEEKWFCFPEIIAAFMGEQFTNPCFHMLALHYFNPDRNEQPEYVFQGSYEANLKGGRIIDYGDDYKKPIISRMTIQLYYNGNPLELVQEWSTEHTVNYPRAVWHKLGIPKNLNPILYDFEKRPVSCDVKLPSAEELCENGTGEIELSNFRDENGNQSRNFNRLLVSIYKGEILNGETSDLGPDYKVFTVGDGTIKVKYRPPADKDDGYEWLRIYSSCHILPPEKYPYSRTLTDKLIIDQRFPIMCGIYKGQIMVTKRWNYKKEHEDYTKTFTGMQTISYSGSFKPLKETEGLDGQPLRMFGPLSVTGTWSHKEEEFCSGSGCGCQGKVYEEFGSGPIPYETMNGLMIITNVWPEGIEKVKEQLQQFGLENWYDIATPTEGIDTERRTRGGEDCSWSTSNSTANLTGADVRFKLKDISILKGSVTWSSSKESTGISITDMTEAIYDQEPFDPEKNGNDFTYTITWDLKEL